MYFFNPRLISQNSLNIDIDYDSIFLGMNEKDYNSDTRKEMTNDIRIIVENIKYATNLLTKNINVSEKEIRIGNDVLEDGIDRIFRVVNNLFINADVNKNSFTNINLSQLYDVFLLYIILYYNTVKINEHESLILVKMAEKEELFKQKYTKKINIMAELIYQYKLLFECFIIELKKKFDYIDELARNDTSGYPKENYYTYTDFIEKSTEIKKICDYINSLQIEKYNGHLH